MNTWTEHMLENEFNLVKVIKNTEKSQIFLLRHKKLEKSIIVKKFIGELSVYHVLINVSHINLPQIYDIFIAKNKTVVLEEYIDGMTVADILNIELYNENGVKLIVKALCDALNILHYNGIIHRDIKPENVIINSNGIVKLIDFDAARLYKSGQSADTKIIGTTGYASPEQYGFNQTDQRSDIFSLGILMNVMLTGQHPSKLLYKGKLSKIIQKCIQIDPEKRYYSVSELKKFL